MVYGRLGLVTLLNPPFRRGGEETRFNLRTRLPHSILTLVPERKRVQSESESERGVQKEKERFTYVKRSFSFCDPDERSFELFGGGFENTNSTVNGSNVVYYQQ